MQNLLLLMFHFVLKEKSREIGPIIVAIIGVAMRTKITTALQQSTTMQEEFASTSKATHEILPHSI